ncbi:hypothetical protein JUJ52_14205 [Virgibacillus sp. AGTR]|uniref:hypothetical protein n=1 Tax=unclassified Virgibacillus TaxID=2620237 RepID=UPI000EF49151|nr:MULTISPECIES: hypothetical protein [unclassified Virgibacillus]MCC2251108.1 hypothetical protein [Virgibacillus sp. AGTR]QRZ19894.1 hypothetical protein JUJ52_09795 [Virgibacillus sp. AGTR]
MKFTGQLISGDLDLETNEFEWKQFKQLSTESVLTEYQLNKLHDYLNQTNNETGQVLTLYDQMPIYLKQEDVNQILDDLEKIRSMYTTGNE